MSTKSSFLPPPTRTTASPRPATSSIGDDKASGGTWKDKMKAKGSVWGKKAIEKTMVVSDAVGGRVNNAAEKHFGAEHFWPTSGDFGNEMNKAARILRAFTVDGIVREEETDNTNTNSTPEKKKKKVKVIRKIPPAVIQNAKGIVIFTAFRTAIAPLGGAGGAGVVIAKLEDGSWSGPASISPNTLTGGFMLGLDVYDAVLILNSQAAVDTFRTHKPTLGAELGIAAGPYGAGTSVESGIDKTPVLSYVKSRGMYAGVGVVGQVFVERFDENAAMYHWPGVKAGDILSGKVKPPREAADLLSALQDAETGRAQVRRASHQEGAILPDSSNIELEEGEVLHLPPTPAMTDGTEVDTPSSRRSSADLSHRRAAPPPPPPRNIGSDRNGSIDGGRRLPPPPPIRDLSNPPSIPSRPVNPHHDSSTSNYSTQISTTPTQGMSAKEMEASGIVDPFTSPVAREGETPAYAAPYLEAAGNGPPGYTPVEEASGIGEAERKEMEEMNEVDDLRTKVQVLNVNGSLQSPDSINEEKESLR